MSGQAPKTSPLCPVCGGMPPVTVTEYGERAECCDLIGWGGKPLVDKHTRARRQEFHIIFDPVWQSGLMTRNEAYCALVEIMGTSREEMHAASMRYKRLGDAIEAAKKLRSRYAGLINKQTKIEDHYHENPYET